MTIYLFEPDRDSCKFDEAHEVGEELVVARCNPPELLEFVEEAFDEIALFVEVGIIRTLNLPIALGRNDNLAASFSDFLVQMIGVIALVGDGGIGVQSIDEFMRMGDVVFLSRAADQPDRIAERVAGSMDLGAQTSA